MFIKYLKQLNQICSKRIEKNNEAQCLTFATYGIINTITPYFLWEYNLQDLLTITLHIIASALCLSLLFLKDWALNIKAYFPLCWYSILFYTLPFLSTYMLFNNGLSTGWIINSILALFLLSFLVDWVGFLILLGGGIIIGWLAYWSSHNAVEIKNWNQYNYIFLLYIYFSSIVIGGIFIRNKAFYNKEKEEYFRLLSGAIAHELRTPLAAIAIGITAIREQSQTLLDWHCPEHNIKLSGTEINNHELEVLNGLLNNVNKVSNESYNIIDMFLVKLKEDFHSEELYSCSMCDCIAQALMDYPLSKNEKELIVLEKSIDFCFNGNRILMIHVLFNLLKNALRHIKAVNKGKIYISLSSTEKFNILHFKDTGQGVSKEIIGNIFNRFCSKTKHGTGIGLSFCKLVIDSFGGKIECESQEEIFIEFTLYFPIIYQP